MQPRKLSGKVALVTGASSGIGEATALALAAEGAHVAITARRLNRLNDLADRIRQAGGDALPIEADVADETQASATVERVLRIHAALPAMKRQGDGHIVIVSSGTGRYIHPSTVYSGTKHAISAIAESLRREIGKDWIRVTCIEPGAVKTEFISHMREDVRKSVEQRLGDMEQLESEDIAAAILYAVTQPRRMNINILTLYPTQQA